MQKERKEKTERIMQRKMVEKGVKYEVKITFIAFKRLL
jgi:hypothetical protein